MQFFDAHTHTQFAAFAEDYKDVIGRALKGEVGLINVGTQKDTSRLAVEIAHEYENEPVFAAVGLHPIHTGKSYHDEQELGTFTITSTENSIYSNSRALENKGVKGFVSRGEEFDYDYYVNLAQDSKVVAIGECGLDYYHVTDQASRVKQKEGFLAQIELAHELKKPLMIHCRSAFADLIGILKANSSKLKASSPGAIHFFSGSKDDAKKLLGLGFAFTFGGAITFPPKARLPAEAASSAVVATKAESAKAGDYDEVIKMLPLEAILSETDAPYVAPAPYRGRRNEPAYVVEVVKKLAELKQVSVDEMASQIFDNAKRVFAINHQASDTRVTAPAL